MKKNSRKELNDFVYQRKNKESRLIEKEYEFFHYDKKNRQLDQFVPIFKAFRID